MNAYSRVGFPTGRDSATFRDNETDISSLSRDKGTTGQAQNFATGRDGILTACPVLSRDVPRDRNERKNIDKMEFFFYDFLFQNIFSCFGTSFSVLEHPYTVLEHPFLLCPIMSRVPSRILAVPARPVPGFGCPGPSRPLARF